MYPSTGSAASVSIADGDTTTDLLNRYISANNLPAALTVCEQLLQTDPENLDLQYKQASLLYHLNRDAEAEALLKQLCLRHPMVAQFHDALGLLYFKCKAFQSAAAAFIRASVLAPDNAEAVLNLAACQFELQQYQSAVKGFAYAADQLKDPSQALLNQAICLGRLKRYSEALNLYDRLRTLTPEDPRMWSGYGVAHARCGHDAQAIACFERALVIQPTHTPAWLNWGVTALGREDLQTAETCFRKAIDYGAGAEAQWNLSLTLLTAGQYAEGFKLFEQRLAFLGRKLFRTDPGTSAPFLQSPEAAWGRSIYLYDEQGLGDAIQFARYLPLLKAAGVARMAVRVSPTLRILLDEMGCVDEWVSDQQTPPAHDLQCPLMSLAGVFESTLQSIPSAQGYLSLGDDHAPQWLDALPPQKEIVGLMWSGNPMNPNDQRRSIPLQQMLDCLQITEDLSGQPIQWVAIGNAFSVDDEALLQRDGRVLNLSRQLDDFMDTAHLLKRCKRVIVVDTSVAHLAGALGVRTHLLLSRAPDWRWGLSGTEAPWYGSVRLHRQIQSGHWLPALQEAFAAID